MLGMEQHHIFLRRDKATILVAPLEDDEKVHHNSSQQWLRPAPKQYYVRYRFVLGRPSMTFEQNG